MKFWQNWKTTICGAIAVINGLYVGFTEHRWDLSIPLITIGLGLITAKDFNSPTSVF